MKNIDEGYIKFDLDWTQEDNNFGKEIYELIKWRDKMKETGMIGYSEEMAVSFGNISIRSEAGSKSFIISATQTGSVRNAKEDDFCTVTNYSTEQNKVWCKGPKKASSESMTHAAIYENDPTTKAVIHIHHHILWMNMLNKVPTSRKKVAYGTPEMAMEIKRLFEEEKLGEEKLLAMSGHDDGIIAFGNTLEEAAQILLEWEEKGNQ